MSPPFSSAVRRAGHQLYYFVAARIFEKVSVTSVDIETHLAALDFTPQDTYHCYLAALEEVKYRCEDLPHGAAPTFAEHYRHQLTQIRDVIEQARVDRVRREMAIHNPQSP